MSLLNRLRPKWQNSDPDVRAEAVRQLAKDDVELLTAVAQGDPDPRVRRIAVKKLDSPRLLLEIAGTDEDESLARFARRRAHQLLVDIACDDRDAEESKRALGLIEGARHIVAVIDKARFEDIRRMAFESLNDDAALTELVCRGKDPGWRSRAFERITDPTALRTIALDENASEFQSQALSKIDDVEILQSIADHPSTAKTVRRQATAKVEQLAPPDHPLNVKKRRALFESLVSRAEALAESVPLEQPDALDALRHEWEELSKQGAADSDLAERFSQAADAFTSARRRLESTARPSGESKNDAAAKPSEGADDARTALCARLEALQGESLESELEAVQAEWHSLTADMGPPAKEIERRFKKALRRIEGEIEAHADARAEQALLNELVDKAELLSESPDLDEAVREWKRLSIDKRLRKIPSDSPLGERLTRASERLKTRQAERSEAYEQEQKKTHAKLEEMMSRMQALVSAQQFSIKEADRVHREAQDFLKSMGPLPKEVSRKKARKKLMEAREALVKRAGEFKELENWKRWANEDIQANLIRRIEALRESTDLPKVAREMRRIHDEWKQAGSAPLEKAEELWHRYKSVRDELKVKCDEFFDQQNQERAGNLEKKQALCEKVEAIQDSENWAETAEEVKKLQAEWKAIGPAPQKHSDAVWKRFRKACDHFFERRKSHFGELKDEREQNLKKKREICEKAESIKESTDWHDTANELKRLQAEWRTIGAVPRKHSDQIWKRFRTACDYFFDRFKRRDEVEHEERVKQREALVVELEGLAGAGDGVAGAEALAEKAQSLWTGWRKLGPVSDNDDPLVERFEKAMHGVLSAVPNAFAGTDLDPSASTKRRTKLCEQMEAVVKEFRVVTQPFEQPLEDLAARLKDALASNTMTGGQRREKRTDWRTVSREADKIRSNWLRTPPVPGDEGRALMDRFESARRELAELSAEGSSRPEPVASRSNGP